MYTIHMDSAALVVSLQPIYKTLTGHIYPWIEQNLHFSHEKWKHCQNKSGLMQVRLIKSDQNIMTITHMDGAMAV
jgi:hypothetical protein